MESIKRAMKEEGERQAGKKGTWALKTRLVLSVSLTAAEAAPMPLSHKLSYLSFFGSISDNMRCLRHTATGETIIAFMLTKARATKRVVNA